MASKLVQNFAAANVKSNSQGNGQGNGNGNGHGIGNGNGHSNGHGNGHSDDHPLPVTPSLPSFVFAANNGSQGTEPWVSDGTASGTHLLLDINPGADGSGFYFGSSFVTGATAFVEASKGHFVFEANDGTHGNEPWVTNGTAQGTFLLADLAPGVDSSFPFLFQPLGGGLVLFGTTGGADFETGTRYWLTDGTVAGTREASQFEPGSPFLGTGGFSPVGTEHLIFALASQLRIAAIDGPDSQLIRDFSETSNDPSLGYLTPFMDNRVLFRVNDGVHGIEPWISNGTADGTYQLADINPGSEGSFAANFVQLDANRALFSAFDFEHGRELWSTDGTAAGTYLVADINPGSASNSLLDLVRISEELILFTANDGVHGDELWVTNGSAAGTMMVRDIYPGPVQAGGPGVPALGSSFPGIITPLGDNRALFSASDPEHGQELWVSNGTAEGTYLVADIIPGTGSGSPSDISAIGIGLAAFTVDDGAGGREPWVTNGTAGGTYRLVDINPGTGGSGALGFTPLSDHAPIG